MSYLFLDANSSILTADSSVVGSAHRPIVQIGSVLSAIPVNFSGSPSISGAITIVGNPSISGTVDIGTISGSVVAFQGGAWTPSVSGTVDIGVQSGSVIAFQGGGWTPSAIAYLRRNDAIASTLGADLTYGPASRDSAGRILTKPFSPEESRVEGYASTVNVSVTTLVAAAGAGLRNYITDVWVANTGAAATLVTFRSGGGTSVLGYTIAPAGSGSNLPGLVTPMRTLANETFDFQASTGTSVLYATVKGFKAP